MTTITIDPPTLSGFSTHYGVQVAIIGDDGDILIALGRVEKRRALAAFARMCRVDLGFRLQHECDVNIDDLRHEAWTVAETCGECSDDPECDTCAEIRGVTDWWLRPALSGEDAFPVTVFMR